MKHAFADGLKIFFTRGALFKTGVRIDTKTCDLLKAWIKDDLENTSVLFDSDEFGEQQYDLFMKSIRWLQEEAFSGKHRKPSKEIARTIHFWLSDKLRYRDDEISEKLGQWVTNKINKHYSNAELVK